MVLGTAQGLHALARPGPGLYTYLAIGVEPTKLTALMSGCCRIASTATLSPCTTLNTPSGSPASAHSEASSSDADGSFSDGGLSDREPDFMWLASDSSSLYPVLIEIETPYKAWFYGDRAEVHSDLTHALGQLAEWRAWFGRGHNHTAFLEYYDIPPEMARRKLEPRYVLVHGRRDNFESIPADAKNVPSRADLTNG